MVDGLAEVERLMATLATWRARFVAGDYPMVCARSGLPADKMVPVEAARTATWPFFFILTSLVT